MIKTAEKKDLAAIFNLIGEPPQFLNSFFVYIEDEKVVGCAALEIYNRKLAQIRSLVVLSGFQNKGIGGKLIQKCIQKARGAGIYEILAVTDKQKLFERVGFKAKL